jgi:hypothetical protein
MTSGFRRLGSRRFSSEPLDIGQPDLHERADSLFQTSLARDLERLLVHLPHFRRFDSLF